MGDSTVLHIKFKFTRQGVSHSLWKQSYTVCKDWEALNRKPALQTGGVEFERLGQVEDREVLVKDAIELHYGKCRIQCFWSLTHIRH